MSSVAERAGSVRMVVDWPDGFAQGPRALAPPASSEIALQQWDARCADDGCKTELVAACYRADLGTWSPEIDPLAMDKLAEVSAGVARRVRGDAALGERESAPMGPARSETLVGEGATARTIFAFSASPVALHACTAVCVGPAGRAPSCANATEGARLVGDVGEPPATSLALAGVLGAIHHPTAAFAGATALLLLSSALAIVLRPNRRRSARSPLR